MEQTGSDGQKLQEIAAEQQKLSELKDCLGALDILQDALFPMLTTPQEQQDAEGRKCILQVGGMRHHQKQNIYFQVRGSRIKIVGEFKDYNTLIEAPIDAVIRVLNSVLDGKDDGFAREWARGEAKIHGAKSIHDGQAFNDAFRMVAKTIKKYRAATVLVK